MQKVMSLGVPCVLFYMYGSAGIAGSIEVDFDIIFRDTVSGKCSHMSGDCRFCYVFRASSTQNGTYSIRSQDQELDGAITVSFNSYFVTDHFEFGFTPYASLWVPNSIMIYYHPVFLGNGNIIFG